MRHQINEDSLLTCVQGEPLACLNQWRREQGGEDGLLLVDFSFQQWWLDVVEPVQLTALYCLENDQVKVVVTDLALRSVGLGPVEQFELWAQEHSFYVVAPGDPLPLLPTYIPKPWGQEIWFTGVEERGVCCFGDSNKNVPIPWLQAVMPGEPVGQASAPLVLLKILDPSEQEVTGDLYFELHQDKREVYVVTWVDSTAWPDGQGAIRYGFDQQRLQACADEQLFRQQYLAAVQDYEQVRREIDALPQGSTVDSGLLQREESLRQAMNDFTNMRPLSVGDVVVVPLLTPHSLQHGVRTIEFQTPVYERQILSFTQKVLTQDHWDTEQAVAQMTLLPPPDQPFETLSTGDNALVERIVDFPDFEVRRVRIEAGESFQLEVSDSYALIMVVQGKVALGGLILAAEEAALLPPGWEQQPVPVQPAQPLVFLLAFPRI